MRKIILIFPKTDTPAMLLPASVLYVAASLVQNGYEVKIIDQRIERNWQEILLAELKDKPLAVGVSAMTGRQIFYGLEASETVKNNSNASVIWGGVHPSLLPEQTLENHHIDFVITGEGEQTFLNLIRAIESGDDYKNIRGLGYKDNNDIFLNQPADFVNLDDVPPLPYYLIDIEKYIAKHSFASGKPGRNVAFYTSRGCPHNCGFCYNQKFNRRQWRGESAESVIAKIKHLINKYQIDAIEIEDDEFFANSERIKKIAELILANNLDIEIFTTCRIDYVVNFMDENYLDLIKRAGFKTLAFGVESGSPKIQKLIKKGITNEQVLTVIKKLKKAGIESKYYFMAGFPSETPEDLFMTTDLMIVMKEIDHNIRLAPWRVFTPYPGTDLYELSLQNGFKPPQSLTGWADYDFNTVKTPWVDKSLEKIIKNVMFLNRFIGLREKKIPGLRGQIIKFYGKIADWRWKNHYFSFVPEKYLIQLF